MPELMTLCSREGGKLLTDGVDEIREAVDFCHYYAMRAEESFGEPIELPGPTGESNRLMMSGKGVFAAISPWNFPVAIFCGQVVAAAVAGNTVLAKPAEQTSIVAHRVIELLHEAGMPRDVVQLLPGDGPTVGSVLTSDPRITGVVFTGGTDTAQIINRALAARENAPLPTLIAETGGMNAMIVDSTALPEQVVVDVIQSAFQSAGQRCSALRVLYLQDDVADRVIEILKGAMDELRIGDPATWAPMSGQLLTKTPAKACLNISTSSKLKIAWSPRRRWPPSILRTAPSWRRPPLCSTTSTRSPANSSARFCISCVIRPASWIRSSTTSTVATMA